MHQVREITGGNVKDAEGRSYPVKTVLPVQSASQQVRIDEEQFPGSQRREEQKTALRQYSESLKQQLLISAGNEMTLASVTRFLNGQAGFQDTAEAQRLAKAGRIVKFLRLFGFEIRGSGPAMTVRKPPAAPSRATGAPLGRPLGAQDLAPRVPPRGLPASQAIVFQPDNPFRGGSAAFGRYEAYKGAATVGEARRLGATPQDFQVAFNRGLAVLQ